MKILPPRLAERILTLFLRGDLAEEVLGDLDENFYDTVAHKTLLRAKLNYWFQVMNYLRPFAFKNSKLINSIYFGMYKNNFKIGYRNLLRNKAYSSINIGGLAVGMAVAMLIGLWVYDELSFDHYHKDHDRIVQVMKKRTLNSEVGIIKPLPFPLKSELNSKYGSDFENMVIAFWRQSLIVSHEDSKLTSLGNFIGKEVIELYALDMLKGSSKALETPNSIIISKTLSEIIFGKNDPLGKLMKIDNEMDVIVTGVYNDPPKNSSLHGLTWIAPWKLLENTQDWISEAGWDNNSFQVFAKLTKQANIDELNEKIKLLVYNNVSAKEKETKQEIFLHPMDDWHLKSNWENGIQSGGLINFVFLFGVIGIFVLILACINFMNLSTAQSERRCKEVGVRKTIGALKSQLIYQFLTESFLVVILAFIFAILMMFLALPYFNELADKNLVMPIGNLTFWFISIGFIITTALLSGSYPALYLSSFSPVKVLKGTFKAGKSATVFRKVSVVLQFTVSIALIIGTLLVEKQIQHSKNRPMGYEVKGTIMVWSNSQDFRGKFDLLRNELKSSNTIVEMSESTSPLTMIFNHISDLSWKEKHPDYLVDFGMVRVTPEYGKTIGWNVNGGRDFSRDLKSDSLSLILNQKAVDEMQLKDPIGTIVKWGDGESARNYRVIGVIDDLLTHSPFEKAIPIVFAMSKRPMNCMTIKLNPNKSTSESLAGIEAVFNKHMPALPFDYRFTDYEHSLKFAAEERIGNLSGIFATLSVFISCLGIFGMASFVAEQRTKEIGIRKVLGASVFSIWKMLAKGFVILVVLSCLIAIPISYLMLESWLASFEYRTSIPWTVFAYSGLGAISITILTVSYHAISSAISNPLISLRFE